MQTTLKIEHIPGKAVNVLTRAGVIKLIDDGWWPSAIRFDAKLTPLADKYLKSIENKSNKSLTS